MAQDQKIVKDERGQEQPADKKRAQQPSKSALEGGAAYAPGNEQQNSQRGEKVELSPAGPGDKRTPDKTIGEVKYADHSSQRKGGAGKP